MKLSKNLSFFVLLFVFNACAKHYEYIAFEGFLQRNFSVKKGQEFLLFVSKENEIFHFVLIDTLGVPKLKKDFVKGEFKSVAFLPPNAEFDALFYEILKQIQRQKNAKIAFEFKEFKVKEL